MTAPPSAIPISWSHIPPGSAWWMYAIVVAVLAFHIGGGSVAIVSGYGAVLMRKGAELHRKLGKVFVIAMLVMAAFGTVLSVEINQPGNIGGGILAAYLVLTGVMTIRQKPATVGRFEKAIVLLPLGVSALFLAWGIQSTRNGGALNGFGSPLYYTFSGLAALFAALDMRMILSGGVSGIQRIRRHLWRMCVGLFFASGSFFLGQQKVMPKIMHGSPVLWVLALAPLGFMIYWLIRTRRKGKQLPALAGIA
ncbi:MAG: hypothetical protein JO056_06500 [Alphaproteobacteria bacterium]|nr:hypothetical protein [Alphaproteobacteria bacterium]